MPAPVRTVPNNATTRTAPAPAPGSDWLSNLGLSTGMAGRMVALSSPDSIGPGFFTPGQADFRDYMSRGFDGNRIYTAEPTKARDTETGTAPGNANVGIVQRNGDGSADMIRLEATADGWIKMPGTIPAPRKVVRW